MASSKETLNCILDQISAAGHVRGRAMFGEYAIYCDEKLVALLCDDRLFVKTTQGGHAIAGDVEFAAPFPRAKPRLLIAEEQWDDAEHMAALIAATAKELPLPKPKRRKSVANN